MAIFSYVVWMVPACAAPQSAQPTAIATAPTAQITVAVPPTLTTPPTQIAIVIPPTPTPAPAVKSSSAALPTVETSASVRGTGFLTPVELELELLQPLSDSSALRQLVEDVQQLDGVASVRSDGVRIQVRYDSTQVLPGRIRARLAELGHPARGGTDVQNPGDAAD